MLHGGGASFISMCDGRATPLCLDQGAMQDDPLTRWTASCCSALDSHVIIYHVGYKEQKESDRKNKNMFKLLSEMREIDGLKVNQRKNERHLSRINKIVSTFRNLFQAENRTTKEAEAL